MLNRFFFSIGETKTDETAKLMKIIIFTDLDGTLLDHKTYSFEPAMPALKLIRSRSIPLIFCSSKTRAEQELLRERMNNTHPFISENGGGIFVPKGYFSFETGGEEDKGYVVTRLGLPYNVVRKEFSDLRRSLDCAVTGFGDMTVGQIADLTGLGADEAALARKRDFGEPFVFEKGEDKRFLRALEERGLNWTRGRLYHVMGDHDKGRAVRILRKQYEREHAKLITIGLGDALNDLPLLREVDRPVLVAGGNGAYDPEVEVAGLIRAKGSGPKGWNEAVLRLLES